MLLHLSKPTPRVKANINYGSGVYMRCQHRFNSCNKGIQLGDADYGRGYTYVRAGTTWEISITSSQFFYEPKTALKK